MPNESKWYSIRMRTAVATAVLVAAASASGHQVPQAKSSAEVLIYGNLGASWWEETITAAQFVQDLAAMRSQGVDWLDVRINSMGGSVPDGVAIHNALKSYPGYVTTTNDGIAASISSLVLMAGKVRRMAANAMLMIHAPGYDQGGPANAVEHREYAAMLDGYAEAMATSYAEASGRPRSEMLAWLADGKDHHFTAEQALAEKLIDEVSVAVDVSASANRQRFDMSRYGTQVPEALHFFEVPAAAAAAPTPQEEPPMPNPTNPAATEQQTAQQTAAVEAAARQSGVQAEALRRADIRAAFAPHAVREGVNELLAQLENDTAVTAAAAKDKLLAHLAKGATPAAGGYVATTEDERDKIHAGVTQAIMARAAVRTKDGYVRADASNPFRGMTLMDVARASLERAGVRTQGMDPMKLVAAAFTQSTSDFPVLLENTMHKTLLSGYAMQADTWSRFCKTGTVSDFRAHNRYRLGSLGNLVALTELGEFQTKAIPDGEKASITAGTKGYLINVSRQTIINDDLGAFVGLSEMMGRAAKRTIEADVYALLASNPTLADGGTLFNNTAITTPGGHANLPTAAAPSVDAFDLARASMAQQMDPSRNDYLDLRPAVWLGPVSLGGNARVINSAEYDPDTSNKLQKPNKVRGLFRDVIDSPRLTGTAWYMFADKDEAPVIEVAFLNGNQEPFLDMEQGFGVDGSSWKVRLDYGVAAVDFRGALKNAGS